MARQGKSQTPPGVPTGAQKKDARLEEKRRRDIDRAARGDIVDQLVEVRDRVGISAVKIAEGMLVNRGLVSMVLNRKRAPSKSFVAKASAYLKRVRELEAAGSLAPGVSSGSTDGPGVVSGAPNDDLRLSIGSELATQRKIARALQTKYIDAIEGGAGMQSLNALDSLADRATRTMTQMANAESGLNPTPPIRRIILLIPGRNAPDPMLYKGDLDEDEQAHRERVLRAMYDDAEGTESDTSGDSPGTG
jgi:hypothetical protein